MSPKAGNCLEGNPMTHNFLEEPKNPGLDDGQCALCKTQGLTEDDRCFGCGYLICEDHTGDPTGAHFVIDHDEDDD